MASTSSNGGRVTTRQLYEAIIEQNKERQNLERRIVEEITQLREDVAGLKVKAGLWGAIAGIVGTATTLGAIFLANLLR